MRPERMRLGERRRGARAVHSPLSSRRCAPVGSDVPDREAPNQSRGAMYGPRISAKQPTAAALLGSGCRAGTGASLLEASLRRRCVVLQGLVVEGADQSRALLDPIVLAHV